MKSFYLFFVALTILVITNVNVSAQSMVSGIIVDSMSNDALPFSSIVVKGTTTGTTTDMNGEFRLSLKPGSYTLVASYIGYEPEEKAIVVNDGQATTVRFSLGTMTIMGKEVTVTAMLRGQKAAISSQLNADGIVNAVSEEQIQELPDANAGDALGRLPGISLKRSGGEAQNIVMRGLNEKYSSIQLNGVPIPSTGGDNRGVDLSLFSLSSLAGIEVTKSLTSDMDADAIAGSVNLVTKKASSKPEFRFDIGGGYNALENSAKQYNLAARYERRVLKEKLGVQASVNSEQKIRSKEAYSQGFNTADYVDSYIITDLSLSYVDETRKRIGASLLLDYATSDEGTIRFNNFYNRTDRDARSYSKYFAFVPKDVSYNINDKEIDIQTLNNSLSGENFIKSIKINWGGSHALTIGNTPYNHSMNFYEGGTSETGIAIPDDILPELIKGPGKLLVPYALNNYRDAYLSAAFFEPSKSTDRELIAYLDLERKIKISDKVDITFKTGGKIKNKNRENESDVYRAYYTAISPRGYSILDDGTIVEADYSNTSFADPLMVGGTSVSMNNFITSPPASREIFDGEFELNPMVNSDLAREWYDTHKNAVSADGSLYEYSPYYTSVAKNYKVSEQVTAAYFKTSLNLGKMFRVIAGVRMEHENDEYTAKFAPELTSFLTFDPTGVADTVDSYSATYILPNFHFRFKPVDWFDLRLAATKTLARPDYSMRLPSIVVDRVNKTINRGNSSLNNTEAWNYDIIASFYKSKYGLFTVGGFYKKMNNVFYTQSDVTMLNSKMASEYNFPQGYGSYVSFNLNEPVNSDATIVRGIEFDLQLNMRFLPGFLSNFILRGNYSLINSETYIPRFRLNEDKSVFPPTFIPEFYETKETLEGQPSKFGNVAIGYDKGGFSGRLSVFFQGDYATSVSTDIEQDVIQRKYSKWDLALKQKIKKINTEIMLNISNISNMSEGSYYRYESLDLGSSIYGMLIDLGVRITL